MNNLKQKLYDLKQQQKGQLDKISAFIEADDLGEGYEAANKAFDELETKIKAVETQITRQSNLVGMSEEPGVGAATKASVYTGVLKGLSQDTVKNFAAGVRKAMSEGIGPDGGFTVPEDVVGRVYELVTAEESMLDYITNTPVSKPSGSRTYKTRQQLTGMQTVEEMAAIPEGQKPTFEQVKYEVAKRSAYLPVTQELLEDSDEDIAALVIEWLIGEVRATINIHTVATAKLVGTTAVASLDDMLKILTVDLNSAIRKISAIHTNGSGLFWLLGQKDANERPLLQANPANPTEMRLCIGPVVIPVKDWDNTTMPNGENGEIPMIIGSLKEGVQRFIRREVLVSRLTEATLGGVSLAEKDLVAFKASVRDDYKLRDPGALKYCELTPRAAG